jgi:hypothetical protein
MSDGSFAPAVRTACRGDSPRSVGTARQFRHIDVIGNLQRAEALARDVPCRHIKVNIALREVDLYVDRQELLTGRSFPAG